MAYLDPKEHPQNDMPTFMRCHRLVRWRMRTCLAFISLLIGGLAVSEELRFQPVKREVIEERLKQVTFGNEKRSKRLQAIFKESLCEGQHFRIQQVPGFNLGNIICVLPGASDSVIIVGAHFRALWFVFYDGLLRTGHGALQLSHLQVVINPAFDLEAPLISRPKTHPNQVLRLARPANGGRDRHLIVGRQNEREQHG
jgi:hypothetical protein